MVRFAGQQIESWNPGIDVRSIEAGRLFVLGGKNYLFDSKGPKSGFGSRLVRGGAVGANEDIQSVDVGKHTLLMSSGGIWRQEYAIPSVRDVFEPTTFWRKLLEFEDNNSTGKTAFSSHRWTGAFVNGVSFIGSPMHGLYKIRKDRAVLHTAAGVPARPIAIAEIAGRLIVVNRGIFAFSGPGDGNDFVPDIGGAGYIELRQFMSGVPIGITVFPQGCIVWSSTSAMIAEYIGGDAVFRFDTFKTKLYPVSPMSITHDANGRSFMMTRHGLAIVEGAQIQDPVSIGFNQMIRGYLNESWDTKIRLDYINEDDMLYVQLTDSVPFYNQTFALNVGIEKWGVFNEEHLGICRFGSQRGATGYADINGFVHKWTDTADKQTSVGRYVGLDSYVDIGYFHNPQLVMESDTVIEMQELVLSARESFPPNANLEVIDFMDLDVNGWWARVASTAEQSSMDWRLPHYVWPADDPLLPAAADEDWKGGDSYDEDYLVERGQLDFSTGPTSIQNWNYSLYESTTPFELPEDWTADNVLDEDYSLLLADKDWNAETYFHPPEILADEDYNTLAGAGVDWRYASGLAYIDTGKQPDWDLNNETLDDGDDFVYVASTPVLITTPSIQEDWADPTGDVDMHGPYSLVNEFSYQVLCMSSFNGLEYDIDIVPHLAIEQFNRDMYTMLTSGRFQAIRLKATELKEKFHVTSIDVTLIYTGQQS